MEILSPEQYGNRKPELCVSAFVEQSKNSNVRAALRNVTQTLRCIIEGVSRSITNSLDVQWKDLNLESLTMLSEDESEMYLPDDLQVFVTQTIFELQKQLTCLYNRMKFGHQLLMVTVDNTSRRDCAHFLRSISDQSMITDIAIGNIDYPSIVRNNIGSPDSESMTGTAVVTPIDHLSISELQEYILRILARKYKNYRRVDIDEIGRSKHKNHISPDEMRNLLRKNIDDTGVCSDNDDWWKLGNNPPEWTP